MCRPPRQLCSLAYCSALPIYLIPPRSNPVCVRHWTEGISWTSSFYKDRFMPELLLRQRRGSTMHHAPCTMRHSP
eukprot:364833-Chlamydomonas_euryale.AAC.7